MNERLSMEMLLELPELVLERTRGKNKYVRPLDSKFIENSYYPELKNQLVKFFTKFHNKKNTTKFSVEDRIRWTKNVDNIVVQHSRRSDFVGNIVVESIADSEWLGSVYDSIINISYKLTKEEGVYFVSTFFDSVKEEVIATNLHIGRTKLQDIKKSCLLKVLSEVEPYLYEYEDV